MAVPSILSTSTGNWVGSYPLAYTQTHDATGASALIVYFFSASSYPSFTPTASYAGVAMTLVGSVAGTSNRTVWVWALNAPASGSNTLSISLAGQYIDNGVCIAVGLTGTAGSGAVGASSFVAATASMSACALTLAGGASLVLGFGSGYFNTPNAATGSPTPALVTSNTTVANYPNYFYTQAGGAAGGTDTFTMDASFNATIAALVEVLGVAGPPAQAISATVVGATFSLGAQSLVLGPAPKVVSVAILGATLALGAVTVVIPRFITVGAPLGGSFALGAVSVSVPQFVTVAPVVMTLTPGALSLFRGMSISVAPLGMTLTLGPASVFKPQAITVAPLVMTLALSPETVVEANFLVFPLTVLPGGTATFHLNFTPAAAGPRTGALSFVSNATPTTIPLSGVGTGAPMLRLSTAGNQIVDSSGAPVRLKSVNWHGAEGSTFCPHGLWARRWTEMLDQIQELGFNCIRLPFSDDILNNANVPNGIDTTKNADLVGLTPLALLDKIINYGGSIGLRFVLDQHRTSSGDGTDGWPNANFTDAYTPAMWAAMWSAMASRYGSNPAVCGFDPHNEPYNPDWSVWAPRVETLANAVQAIAPDWLVFVEGVGAAGSNYYWWGGQLQGMVARPIVLTRPNKVVYSPHEYGLSVGAHPWLQSSTYTVAGWPNNLAAVWATNWAMKFLDHTAPLWIGEFGGQFGYNGAGAPSGSADAPFERQWLSKLIQYLNGDTDLDGVSNLTGTQKGMSFSYWTFGPDSSDTGGILEDDWTTVQAGKMTLLQPLLAA